MAALSQAVQLQPEFGYVLLVLVFGLLVHHMYMSMGIGKARKKYNVKYPTMYADASHKDANMFNAVQRGHQNSLENEPMFIVLLLLAGLKYPVVAAVAGLVYVAGRIQYFRGYSTGDPDKRMQGGFMYFGLLTLLGCVVSFAISLLLK
jgi:glutathione S-transferase